VAWGKAGAVAMGAVNRRQWPSAHQLCNFSESTVNVVVSVVFWRK